MSYISAWRTGDDVYVWERTPEGRITKKYKGIFEFFTQRHDGTYTSIYDEPLIKHQFNTYKEMYESKQFYATGYVPMYESDIRPETKILAKHYFEQPEPALHFTFWDIENDYDPQRGYASIEDPYAPINAIALYHHWKKESVVIAVPPKSWDKANKLEQLAKDTGSKIILVENEKQLLTLFLDQIEDSDTLCGWNSKHFDTPYTAKRVERVLGKVGLQRMSFPDARAPKYDTIELYGQEKTVVDLGGRISWDYMELFKKYDVVERPSYSLDAISNEVLPDLPKLKYSGSLADLYNKDFEYFIRYNIRDTEILKGFEETLGYAQLANLLYHSGCGQPDSILGTINLTDLSIINYCHYKLDRKVPDGDPFKQDGTITGAMVLTPKRGLHNHIGSIDVTSLYPSAIRCINISPETLIGQLDGTLARDDRAVHSGWKIIFDGDPKLTATVVYDSRTKGYQGTETHTGKDWKRILKQRKWSVSGYGTFFSQSQQGVIPAVLTDWFEQRVKYKKLKSQAQKAYDKLSEITNPTDDQLKEMAVQKDKAAYYDRVQNVMKIKLNATYGAMTNLHFRFFDLRLGQSTTGTGRAILEHMCSQVALMLDGKYDMHSESIAYGDSVAGNSVLYTSDNKNVKIEDLFETCEKVINGKDYYFPKDLRVLTYDEKTNSSCYKNVKYVMKHKNTKQMFRVWITNATYIDVTEDHSLMGYVNTKERLKNQSMLREIKPEEFGGKIRSLIHIKHRPREINKFENCNNFSKEFFELLGLIVGDGGANTRCSGVDLSVGSKDKSEIEIKVINPLIHQGWITSVYHVKNQHDVKLCGTKLWDTVRQLLYVDNQKVVPEWLFNESEENIASFIRGYFTADGTVTGKTVRLCSTRVENIQRVQQLLTYCGISSNYFTENTENSYKGKFSNTFTNALCIKSTHAFREKVGFILSRKNDRIPQSGKKDNYFKDLDFDITHVNRIEKIDYEGYVYDVEIDDTHTFFANNILVHNTDSCYFKTNADSFTELTREQQLETSIQIADEVGKQVNASYNDFCESAFCIQPEYKDIIQCAREVVAKRGIFVTKKRYVLKLIDLDGRRCNKLKAMGLEMKKTTTPKIIRTFLEDVVNLILDGEQSWDQIDDFIVGYRKKVRTDLPLVDIGLPKGVKNVETYTDKYKLEGMKARLPGHVAASIHYNECLKQYNDKENQPITSGNKIKVFYLTKKYGKFKSIAIPTDMEQVPQWFADHFECKRDLHENKLIDKNLQIIFNSIDRIVPTAQTQFTNAILDWGDEEEVVYDDVDEDEENDEVDLY